MGNNSSKDSRVPNRSRHIGEQSGTLSSEAGAGPSSQSHSDRLASQIYSMRNASGRGSRPDLSFLTLGRDRDGESTTPERPRETKQEKEARRLARDRQARLKERERSIREEGVDGGFLVTLGTYTGPEDFNKSIRKESTTPERPRETKQEKEARRLARDRQARLKERERSIREEGVDGGFLVTLGTYTGPEDFNKSIVRQLQIERRLAPFWKGLNDHDDSWTEAQLVAAVRGLPIPAADEVPPTMERSPSQASSNPGAMDTSVQGLTIPISSRAQSYQNETTLSASHPAFSSLGPPSSTSPSSSSLLRGRAKTLASLATGAKSQNSDLTPQEIRLQKDPNVNGLPMEAYLYREASECPICFMYYPPFLNRTRCCDQSICSECFVQIKRPDPHPPEHEQPGQTRPPEEEAETLVSEVAACPFCVTPEFGITYDPPPFRRGLAYANHSSLSLRHPTSAMSSSSSLTGGAASGRRRAASLSANAPQVVTTDRVRPDWAKKLADARANALRRSAAATALHNAAYVLGNQGDGGRGIVSFGRRRRQFFADSPGAGGSGTTRMPEGIIAAAYGDLLEQNGQRRADGDGDLYPGRTSSRRNRVEDLEDLMMMEAIRLSLAVEEDRKRREEKDAAKDAKKKAKETKKEEKKAEKLAKKNGGNPSLYPAGSNDSVSTWATTSMARSTSNFGGQPATVPEEPVEGKGKQPAQDVLGNRSASQSSPFSSAAATSQDHPEEMRPYLANPSPVIAAPTWAPHMRHLSSASSAASSFADSHTAMEGAGGTDAGAHTARDDSQRSSTPPAGVSSEPMLNFRSLAAMIGDEDKERENEHIEHVNGHSKIEDDVKEPSPTGSPRVGSVVSLEGKRSRGDSGESSSISPLPTFDRSHSADEQVTSSSVHDEKDLTGVGILGRAEAHEATQ
nr:protein sip5 [Quercus suber]